MKYCLQCQTLERPFPTFHLQQKVWIVHPPCSCFVWFGYLSFDWCPFSRGKKTPISFPFFYYYVVTANLVSTRYYVTMSIHPPKGIYIRWQYSIDKRANICAAGHGVTMRVIYITQQQLLRIRHVLYFIICLSLLLDSQSSTAVKLSKVKTFHFVLRRNKSVANLSIWVLNVGPERKLVYWCWMKNRSIYSLYDTHSWTWWWWGGNFSYLSYHIEAATKVRFHIISNE